MGENVKIEVDRPSGVEAVLQVEVPAERVDAEVKRALREVLRSARIPGFRPGKAPVGMIRSRFKRQIEDEVSEQLIRESLGEALMDKQLMPVAPPVVSEQAFEEGQPFRYVAHVEVRPEVKLHAYKGLHIERRKADVGAAEVEAELERMRKNMGHLEPVDGRDVAQKGDYAVIDFHATVGLQPFEGGDGKEVLVVLGEGRLGDHVESHIIGHKVGEDFAFNASMPEEHPTLKGQEAAFTIKIHELKTLELPELDDAFAKDAGAESFEDLRNKVEQHLVAGEQRREREETQEAILHELVRVNPLEVPPSMVRQQAEALLEGARRRMAMMGLPGDIGKDLWERISEETRGRAENDVRATLLVQAVIEEEKLEVSDEELEQRLAEMAESSGQDIQRIRGMYSNNDKMEGLRYSMLRQKALDLLVSQADIVEQRAGTSPAST